MPAGPIIVGENDLFSKVPRAQLEWATTNIVDPQTLRKSSPAPVTWVCLEQGHTWVASPKHRFAGSRSEKWRGCGPCKGKTTFSGVNSIDVTHPNIAKQWHPENLKTVREVRAGAHKSFKWLCTKGHTFSAEPYRLTGPKPRGCAVCSGKQVQEGFSDVASSLYADEYSSSNREPAKKVHKGTHEKVEWVCSKGHTWITSPHARDQSNTGCPTCGNWIILAGYNDLKTTHPELALEWDKVKNKKNLEEVHQYKREKAWWLCVVGHSWSASITNRAKLKAGCPKCVYHISRGEQELYQHVLSIFPSAEQTAKIGGCEVDVYIPELKIGIEYNGLYWHSDRTNKDPLRHQRKYKKLTAEGVRLLVVWEDDWISKRTLVEKMLARKLNVSTEKKIDARKTSVGPLSKEQARHFLEDNHIQGKTDMSYAFALYTEDTPVAVMTFLRSSISGEYILARFATSCIVRGGFSRLLKHAENEIKDLEVLKSFADLSISDGGLYATTGWTLEKEIAPDYQYVYKNKRNHKFGFRLKRFKNDPELIFKLDTTEKELARINKIHRIYDYGKLRYTKRKRKH